MGVYTALLSSVLVVVAFSVFADAGGYGGHGHGVYGYQYAQPQTFAYYQPARVPYVATGINTGVAGGSGGLGSIIPIAIIFVVLAILAPLLISSLLISNQSIFGTTTPAK